MSRFLTLFFCLAFSLQLVAQDTLPLMEDLRFFVPLAISTRVSEIHSNKSEIITGFGASKNLFALKKFLLWPSVEYNYAYTLSSGNDDYYVKPRRHLLVLTPNIGYAFWGYKSAVIPYLGLKSNIGFVHIKSKLLKIEKSHYQFAWGIRPDFGILFQHQGFGLSIHYGLGFDRRYFKQVLGFDLSYSAFLDR